MATQTWDFLGSGFWDGVTNWSSNVLPGASDDVVIDVPGTVTVTHRFGGTVVNNLTVEDVLALTGGSLGVTTFGTIRDFILEGGNLAGSGIFLVDNFTWTGGNYSGTGLTIREGGVGSLAGPNTLDLDGTLTNQGTVVWTGGTLRGMPTANGVSNANWNNATTGLLDIQGDHYYQRLGGTPILNNAGTLRKSAGTGTATIEAQINNSGTVETQRGTLALVAGGSSSGRFQTDAGAVTVFQGNHSLAGVTFTGAGTTQFNGAITVSGTSTASGKVQLAGGSLASPGTFLVDNFTWTGGNYSGTGLTIREGGVGSLAGPNTLDLDGTLTNQGTVVWTGGTLRGMPTANGVSNANWNNATTGLLDIQGDHYYQRLGGTPILNNAGTLRKSAGTGTATIEAQVNNSGTVETQRGTLSFTGGYKQTAGWTILNGGSISSSSLFDIQSGGLAGYGSVFGGVQSAGLIDPGLGIIDPALAIGTLNINGNYAQQNTGVLSIELGSTSQFDRLAISGNVALDGVLRINLLNGFLPQLGDRFRIMTFGSASGKFDAIELPDLAQSGLKFTVDNLADGDLTLIVEALSPPPSVFPYQIVEADNIDPSRIGNIVPRSQLASGNQVLLTSSRTDVPQNSTEVIGNNLYNDGSDVDIFGVELQAGDRLLIDVDAFNNDGLNSLSNLDSVIRVFSETGQELAIAFDSDEPNTVALDVSRDPSLQFTALSSGIYYIGISAQGNQVYNPFLSDKNSPGSNKVDPGTPNSQGAFQLELKLFVPIQVKNPIPSQIAYEDNAFSFAFGENTFFDDEGDPLTYSATLRNGNPLPTWLNFNAATRTFSGTPANDHIGSLDITVTANDGNGETASDSFELRIGGTNDVPRLNQEIVNQKVAIGTTLNFTLPPATFIDIDPGDVLTYTATLENGSPLPNWLSFNPDTRTFSGTPTNADVGLLNITITATDILGTQASDTFSLGVGVNLPPTGKNKTITTNEDTVYLLTVADFGFSDMDGNALNRILLTTVPSAVSGTLALDGTVVTAGTFINVSDIVLGRLQFTPVPNGNGNNYASFTFQVEDNGGTANGGVNLDPSPNTVSFNITPVNDAPTGTVTIAGTAAQGQVLTAANTLGDADGLGPVAYTWFANGVSTGVTVPTYILTPADVGKVFTVTAAYTDGQGTAESVTSAATATVLNINNAPTGTITITGTAIQGGILTVTNTLTDADGVGPITYTWFADGVSTGVTTPTYTLTQADVGKVFTVTAAYTDGRGTAESVTSTATSAIVNVNDAPTGTPTATLAAGIEDTIYTITSATLLQGFIDVDGDTLSISGLTASTGSLVDNNNGTYSFTPTPNFNGTVTLNYAVVDGKGGSVGTTQTVVIAAVNDAPLIANAIADQTATEDTAFSFVVPANAFSDVDASDVLTYSTTLADNAPLPTWLTFNATTRTFSGTPDNSHVGNLNIKVTATDASGSAVSDVFGLAIANVNDAPTLTGTAATLATGTEDTAYTITTTQLLQGFTDVDGDILAVSGLTANNGSLTNNGTYTFTPNANFNGTVTLNYSVIDGNGGSVAATQTVAIAPVNDAPTGTATATLTAGTEDTVYTITTAQLFQGFTDVDGDTLAVSGLTANNGSLTNNNGTYIFTPNANFNGTVTLSYSVLDGNGGSIAATQTLAIAPVNDAPIVANTLSAQTAANNTPFNFTIPANTFSDIDSSDSLTYTATLSTGTPLPPWLSFNSTTRTFSGTPPTGGSFSIQITATDTAGASVNTTFDLAVLSAPPVLDLNGSAAGLNFATSFTEGQSAIAVSNSLTLTDADSTTITAATITLTNPLDGSAESLVLTNTLGYMTATYNAATATLQLTGTATLAQYQQVLRTLRYTNTSQNPNPTPRTINFVVNDGATTSEIATTTVSILPVNDVPVLDLNGPGAGINTVVTFTEDRGATIVSSTLNLLDLDNPNLTSATIQLRNLSDAGAEFLSASTTGTDITATYNAATGRLELSGTAAIASYQQVLRTVAYNNTAQNPTTTARLIDFAINDGTVNSPTATAIVGVVSVNDLPVITLTGNAPTYIENGAVVIVDGGITLSDADHTTLQRATVRITNVVSAQDRLDFTPLGTITGSFSAGMLTLTGTASLADYQTVLRSVTYSNTSDRPTLTPRTLDFIVNDGRSNSLAARSTVAIAAVNDAPVLNPTGVRNLAAINEDPITNPGTLVSTLFSGAISDLDAGALQGIAVTTAMGPGIWQYSTDGTSWLNVDAVSETSALLLAPNTRLRFSPQLDFNGTVNLSYRAWDQTSGMIGSLANTSVNTSNNGGITAFSTAIATSSVTINPVNDAPVNAVPSVQALDEDTFLIFSSTNGNPISISDVDAASNPVRINLAIANGTLQLGSLNGLTSISGNGTANITAIGTMATLNEALNGLQFTPIVNFNGTTNLTVTTNDLGSGGSGGARSDSDRISITVNPVNDAPVNNLPTRTQTVRQGSSLVFSNATGNRLSISDIDAGTGMEQVNLSITHGTLTLGNTTGLTSVVGNTTNSLNIQGSLANLNASLLSGLQFTPDAAAVLAGAVTLTIQTNDLGSTGVGSALSDIDTLTIAVTPANPITGTSGNNSLYGSSANNFMQGLAGNDTLYGYGGNDIFLGGDGNDEIYSAAGNDFMDGGLGNDILWLGGGQDTVVLRSGNGADTIYNYASGSTRFKLDAGLSFNTLEISQAGSNTLLRTTSGELLVSLMGTQASSLGASSFI